jgi:hypothetical protein
MRFIWSRSFHRSLIGSRHRRLKQPCQDASGTACCTSKNGLPVSLIVVADGHGGELYQFSDVGAQLVCREAIGLICAYLEQQFLAPDNELLERGHLTWLREVFPQLLRRQWLECTVRDWQARSTTAAYNPYLYGTTIGLVIMTPFWYAYAGIGDWDLTLIHGDGRREILSEEDKMEGASEITESIVQRDATRMMADRTALISNSEAVMPFCLALSTDGIRKSCSTDAGFLEIIDYLALRYDPNNPNCRDDHQDEDLNRISKEGSGDDVSLAICRCLAASDFSIYS